MNIEVRSGGKTVKVINRLVDTVKSGNVLMPFVRYQGKNYRICYETPRGKKFIKL